MMNNKKSSAPLLLAGLAALAYYKYKKMTPEQKNNIVASVKQKGKDLYDKYVPQSVKDMINQHQASEATPNA